MKYFIFLLIVTPFLVNGQSCIWANTAATGANTGANWADAFSSGKQYGTYNPKVIFQ
jgi:hypothetical protein